MIPERDKGTHTQGEKEMLQEMAQLVVFVKENNCNRFYSKSETFFEPLVIVGFSLQDKSLVQALHRERQKRVKKKMVSICDL